MDFNKYSDAIFALDTKQDELKAQPPTVSIIMAHCM